MSINECPKSDNGTIAGTKTGTDEALALKNQQEWGKDFVCKDSATGDFYVLNGAVAASNRATSSASPKKQSADLKRDINNLIGEISSLQIQIEKYKKELGSSSDSQSFLSKPSTVFALEMLGLAVGFGGIVPFLEDVRHAVKLRNPQELVDRTNKNIQQMGGCGALPNAAGSAGKAKWAVAGLAAGGLLAYDAFASSGSGGDQTASVPSQPLPNYTDTMNENELQVVYDRLVKQQQGLVAEKVELEKKIASKPGQDKSTLDKVSGNPLVKAAGVFGVFGLAVPAIRDRYMQTSFHKKVMAADQALNLRAQQLAVQTMANGQCSVEAVTAQEPAKATVVSTKTSAQFSMVDDPLTSAGLVSFDRGGMIHAHWVTVGGETYGLNLDAPHLTQQAYANLEDFLAARDSLALARSAEPTADEIVNSLNLKGAKALTTAPAVRLSNKDEAAAAAADRMTSGSGGRVTGFGASGAGVGVRAPVVRVVPIPVVP